jgi:hypothetical protein
MAAPMLKMEYGTAPNNITLTVVQAEGSIPFTFTDPPIITIAQLILAFNSLVTLKKFDFFVDPSLGANKFHYKLDRYGRKWNQILTIAQADITIEDLGSDEWLLSEINHIRDIRALIVPLVLSSGLTEITGRW